MNRLTIQHGKPTTPFFMIAMPQGWQGVHKGTTEYEKSRLPVIKLKHPKKEEELLVEINDFYGYEFCDIPNSISRLTYGINADQLRSQLLRKYPDLKEKSIIEFLICKQLTK